MSQFLTHSKFHSQEEANEFISLLQNANIDFEMEREKNVLDKIYIGESLDPMFAVKIAENNFAEANSLLLANAQSQLNNINPDYYLFNFSNQELIDVVNSKNDWNIFDQALASKILSDRKIEIPTDAKQTIVNNVYTPIEIDAVWLILEYLLSIVVPFAGAIIGLATIFAYKTLGDGRKVKIYNETTRTHGKIIFAIGIVWLLMILGFLILALSNRYN